MFEHVGVPHYTDFFEGCAAAEARRRRPDPFDRPRMAARRDQAWIQKYIFPGGYIPALSEVMPDGREGRPVDHRRRDPAAALRRDPAPLARAVRAPLGRDGGALRRALLPDVGVLPRLQRAGLPLHGPHGLPDAADQRPDACRSPATTSPTGSAGIWARPWPPNDPRGAPDRSGGAPVPDLRHTIELTAGRALRARSTGWRHPLSQPRDMVGTVRAGSDHARGPAPPASSVRELEGSVRPAALSRSPRRQSIEAVVWRRGAPSGPAGAGRPCRADGARDLGKIRAPDPRHDSKLSYRFNMLADWHGACFGSPEQSPRTVFQPGAGRQNEDLRCFWGAGWSGA